MSDQGKIWFIYQTDHHEGPFTAEEVADKARQGLVNGQTLSWKDGMGEWVAAETIPELAAAFGGGSDAVAAPTNPEGEVSLAQLLASQQQNGAVAVEAASPGASAGSGFDATPAGGSAISSMMNGIPASSPAASAEGDPLPSDEVWTLKVGHQVSGLYSMDRLRQLAGEGEIPADAMLWHPGWSDFRPVSSVTAVNSARRVRPAGATRAGMQVAGRPAGMMPLTAAASFGDDDVTDPQIKAPGKAKAGMLAKLMGIFARKPKATSTQPGRTGAVTIGAKKRSGGLGASVKKIATLLVVIAVLGGGGAAYFLFFASPIPSNLDVLPDDRENLALLVKEPLGQGKKFAIAQARGTEDNPADDTSPKFYVASNMPEGTQVSLKISGKPGTLVNKVNFEKTFNGTLAKTHLAAIEISDDGKPIPMGEYNVKVTAADAEPYEVNRFLGGKKGAVYDRRLKQYREKLEKEYSEEVEEIRELVSTLRNLQGEVSKRFSDYKASAGNPANHTRIAADWRNFSVSFDGMASQLDVKLKAKLDTSDQRYYPRAYQDIKSTLDQLRMAVESHGQRIGGAQPKVSPDEQEALVQAGIQSLDQVLAQAVVKTPFDALKGGGAPPAAVGAPGSAPQK